MEVNAACAARATDSGAASAMHATSAALACTTARILLSPIQPTPRNPRRGRRAAGLAAVAVLLTVETSSTFDQRLHESGRTCGQGLEGRAGFLQRKAVGPQGL